MTEHSILLCGTAALVALIHTILGPDHYVPFVAMSRVGGWSLGKTVAVTLLCGAGHVLSSAVLGLVGIAVGAGVLSMERIEHLRGDVAGWLLLAFGIAYFVWGVRRAVRRTPHTHRHVHADGTVHAHEHGHDGAHLHVHRAGAASCDGAVSAKSGGSMTPWLLFVIFLFGPCEPLIPLVMYPAAKGSAWDVVLVTVVFGMVTLATMTAAVLLARGAIGSLISRRFETYGHALAGLAIVACGIAVTAGL